MRARWITFMPQIEKIISRCEICTIGMIDDENKPYVVPMNFGYKDGYLYLHSDCKGKKMDALRMHPFISLSMSTDHNLGWQNEKVACSYSMSYRSVFASGEVEFIEDYEAKVEALNIIMAHYTDRKFTYNKPAVVNVCVFKVKLENITAKEFGRLIDKG